MNKERLYSVTMTEMELRLFSEFLDQKNFDNEVDEAIRKATRGELSEFEAKRAAIHGWSESSKSKVRAADFAVNLYEKDPSNYKKYRQMKDYYNRAKNNVDHSDQIIEQRQKALLDLNKISRERNERELSSIADSDRNQITYNPKVHEIPIIDTEIEEETPIEIKKFRNAKLGIPEKLPEVNPVVREDTAEVRKIKRDDLKEKYVNKARQGVDYAKEKANQGIDYAKAKYNALDDKYDELFGRDLGRDAAITAGVTAGLGLGIHAIRKHNKKKKASKDQVESKYKTKKK